MTITIAEGEVPNYFIPLLPRVTFGNEDATSPGASFGQGTLSNPAGNVRTRSDVLTAVSGGPVRAVSINRDGSVIGSNRVGGTTRVASEKRPELIPFNESPKPLSASQPGSKMQPLSPKAKGWLAAASLIAGTLLLL